MSTPTQPLEPATASKTGTSTVSAVTAVSAPGNGVGFVPYEKMMRSMEGAAQFGREAMDAVIESSRVLTDGYGAIGREMASFVQGSITRGSESVKKLSDVKTPREFFTVQGDMAQTHFSALLNHNSKLSDLSIKVAGDAMEPWQKHLSTAMQRFGPEVRT